MSGTDCGTIITSPAQMAAYLLAILLSLGQLLSIISAKAETSDTASAPTQIAVLDMEYVDTSGEVRDQRLNHERLLRQFSHALRRDLAQSEKYRIVELECCGGPSAAAAFDRQELLTEIRKTGTKILLVGGIHKMSTLVQWAKIQAIDVEANRVVLDKLLSFRGDTDEAWQRAERFIAREIIESRLAP